MRFCTFAEINKNDNEKKGSDSNFLFIQAMSLL